MTEKEESPSFIVSFLEGDVEFGPASKEMWWRYLEKIANGDSEAGKKELCLSCCTSLGVDERTGEHDLIGYLDKEPAAPVDIVDEITAISSGEDPTIAGRSVKLHNMTFRAPNAQEWSEYRENNDDPKFMGGEAVDKLLTKLCDVPDIYAAYIQRYPASLGSIVIPLGKLAGRGIKIQRKK